MSKTPSSPLARLVLFMVCLSIAGGFVGIAHYYAVDLPEQQKIQAPANSCAYTYGECNDLYYNYRHYTLCCYKDCCATPMDCEWT